VGTRIGAQPIDQQFRRSPDIGLLSHVIPPNVLRNLGASIGTAMLSTAVQVREQFHFSVIADHLTQNDLRLHERLGTLTAAFGGAGHTATMRGLGTIANQVRTEAYVLAYADSFWLLGVLIVASMAAVLLLTSQPPVLPRLPDIKPGLKRTCARCISSFHLPVRIPRACLASARNAMTSIYVPLCSACRRSYTHIFG
jgi:hypothetical protein